MRKKHQLNSFNKEIEDMINKLIQQENKIRQVMGNNWMVDYELLTFYYESAKGDPLRQARILELIFQKVDIALEECRSEEDEAFLKTLYQFLL